MNEVENTTERIAKLETGQQSLVDAVSRLTGVVERLDAKVTRGQQTPWASIWGGLSVSLVFVAMVGGLVAHGINSRVDHMESELKEHEALEAHAPARERLGRNAQPLDHIEQMLYLTPLSR